jgi:GNAT superfamily N-acetyltransferase
MAGESSAPLQYEIEYREEVRGSDAESVRKVVRSTGFFRDEEVDIAVELVAERLAKGLSSGYHFLFAEQEARLLGYTCFGPIPGTLASYDLYWIVVRQGFRGQGVGKGLLEHTERRIVAMGGKRLYADTSSQVLYEPTRAFYAACGFAQEALLADFYAPGDHKAIYVKPLLPSHP